MLDNIGNIAGTIWHYLEENSEVVVIVRVVNSGGNNTSPPQTANTHTAGEN